MKQNYEPLKHLKNLAYKLGIYVILGDDGAYTVNKYKRKTITLEIAIQDLTGARNIANALIISLAHEIGHYVVATPTRRNVDNFGLYPSKDYYWLDEMKTLFIEQWFRKYYKIDDKLDIQQITSPNLLKVKPEAASWFRAEGKRKIKTLVEFLGD